jgi:hypothetical protein
MTTVAVENRPFAVVSGGERFYVGMAAACVLVAFVGFAPTYWIPLLRGRLEVSPLVHVHATFFYGWLLLFLRQTSLAASGRLTRHQEFGVFAVALATGMCFVGSGVAINRVKELSAAGFADAALRFSIVPLTAAALFAVLFAIAVYNVKRPEIHKRVMLVATVSLLQAAVARWFALFLAPPRPPGVTGPLSPPPVAVTVMSGLVSDLLIVAAIIHDRRTRGRVHPAYWIAGGAVLAIQVLRVPVSMTSAWMNVATWVVALMS